MLAHQFRGDAGRDATPDQLRLQLRLLAGRAIGGVARRLDFQHGRPAAFGERPEFGPGLGAGLIEHDPVGLAVAIGGLLKIDLGDIAGLLVRAVNLVHLAPHIAPNRVAGLRGMGTEIGIDELGPGPVVFQGGVHLVAEQFVEPLRGRGQAFEVIVIERPCHRPVDDLHEHVIENDIDAIGLPAVGQLLAGEDDAVAGETRFQRSLRAVAPAGSESSP